MRTKYRATSIEVDVGPKVKFGGGGNAEVNGVEKGICKSKIHYFAKSKKQASGSALVSGKSIDATILARIDTMPLPYKAPSWCYAFHKSLQDP